jgi:hypothetical protein
VKRYIKKLLLRRAQEDRRRESMRGLKSEKESETEREKLKRMIGYYFRKREKRGRNREGDKGRR